GAALPAATAGARRRRQPRRDRRAAPGPRAVRRMSRTLRLSLTLVVTGLCSAYILWKIDVGKTLDLLPAVRVGYFVLALAIMVVTVPPMAWRWQRLLAARGVEDRLGGLTRAYFTAHT